MAAIRRIRAMACMATAAAVGNSSFHSTFTSSIALPRRDHCSGAIYQLQRIRRHAHMIRRDHAMDGSAGLVEHGRFRRPTSTGHSARSSARSFSGPVAGARKRVFKNGKGRADRLRSRGRRRFHSQLCDLQSGRGVPDGTMDTEWLAPALNCEPLPSVVQGNRLDQGH